MQDWIIILKLSALFLALFVSAELLYRFAKLKAEITRKLVHVGTGLLTMLFPVYFQHLWQAVLICSSFLVILLLSRKFNFLPSINAVQRSTTGSILYPIIVVGVFAFYQYMQSIHGQFEELAYFYLPILVMAICDPVAALGGKLYQRRYGATNGKTPFGSFCFFIMAIIVSSVILMLFNECYAGEKYAVPLGSLSLLIFAVSISSMLAERFSDKGWDNFTIPSVVMLCLYVSDLV